MATRKFVTADIGNIIHVISGTNATAGWYKIKELSGDNAVFDRVWATGACTDGVAKIGGALKSLGGLGYIWMTAAQAVAGMKAYVENGTYTFDTATANTAATTGHGGPLDLSTAGSSAMYRVGCYIKGYDAAEGRDSFAGTRPIIACGAITPTIAKMIYLDGYVGNDSHVVTFLELDGNSKVTNGITGTTAYWTEAANCYIHDCDITGDAGGIYKVKVVNCRSSSNASMGFYVCKCFGCLADGNGGMGFKVEGLAAVDCIAYNNTGTGFYGYYEIFTNCVAYGNGGNGFDVNYAANCLINCVAYLNTGYEFKTCGSETLHNCAARVGGSGRVVAATPPFLDQGPITLTADPFTNAAALDFSLNNTAGGGALLRAAGMSPYGQTGYPDIGAVQHEDAGGGGAIVNQGLHAIESGICA